MKLDKQYTDGLLSMQVQLAQLKRANRTLAKAVLALAAAVILLSIAIAINV